MGLTPLHVCMDSLSSDRLQGTVHEECGMDCSSPSGDMLACSRPLMERRLRPQHDQPLKCPRCDSTHTKFCYYNNYSLSQPRYFCKSCRRYWTKGGTLRNIPVGGGCRKNKKVSKKSNNNDPNMSTNSSPSPSLHDLHHYNANDLRLSQFGNANPTYMLQSPDFMESSSSRNYDIMGSVNDLGMVSGFDHNALAPIGYRNLCESPIGMGNVDGTYGSYMDTCQRVVAPCDQIQRQPNDYDNDNDNHQFSSVDVKPNTKVLSLEWQDQGSSDNGYLNSTNWAGLMNGYGSSTTKPMV